MIICFLGPEGSGKGTQAEMLAQKLQIPHIITGDILRQRQHEDSPIGELIRETFAKGSYLPDDKIIEIFLNHIQEADCTNGFIADGYPRSIGQAEALNKFLGEHDKKIDYVFALTINEEESVKRLMARGRFDDTPEQIKGRLATYYDRVQAMLDYYKEQDVLETIDGERSIEAIHADIVSRIEQHE